MIIKAGISSHIGPLWVDDTLVRVGSHRGPRHHSIRHVAGVFTAVLLNVLMMYFIITGHFGWMSTTFGVALGLLMATRDRHHRGRRRTRRL
jgi:hypothetical protein